MFENILNNINKKINECKIPKSDDNKTRFINYLENEIFDIWFETSRIENKKECYKYWRELLDHLYKCKALNKKQLYQEIIYQKQVAKK